jgi:CheY-like chemotaxis protein
LKIFSHPQDVRSEALDIHRVLESCLRMAWNEVRHRARLVKEYGAVSFVEGAESRLGQVFLNLIVNAAQSIAEGDADGNAIRIGTRMDAAGRVVVSISDTGVGIPAENMQHLFRPFFTTKGPGVGTGLGLAICHRIVTGLGGDIRVDSKVGAGTTVSVILPPAQAVQPAAAQVSQAEMRPKRRARILVIDDEPLIAMVIQRMLSTEHEVVATTAGREAVDRVKMGEHFDVVLCDLMMPQMSGMEVYSALQEIGPEVAERVVFLTGGAFTQAARAFLDVVPNQRVEKPFDVQQLRAVVNDRIR